MPRRAQQPIAEPIFHEPAFGEKGALLPDPNHFITKHLPDKKIYDDPAVQNALKNEVVSFDKSRLPDGEVYPLAEAFGSLGADFVKSVSDSGQIIFHCLGDSGATQDGKKYLTTEIRVADMVSAETRLPQARDCAAFMYHLGDIVYDFGESEYDYDQFYEPFRNYTRPIFVLPGNHDSFVVPKVVGVPETDRSETPLQVFQRNFCSPDRVITPEAGSLHRTAMTQPGVYFTLDAPFVRIIGLFSNALEDPGVISSEDNYWQGVPDYQLAYLTAQLTKIRDDKYAGAVLIALHHPPFSYRKSDDPENNGGHRSSAAMLREIDTICKNVGVYPHAVISGHAHNYQRYTRAIAFQDGAQDYQVPFIICGNSGHNSNPLVYDDYKHQQDPTPGMDVSYLEADPAVTSKKLTMNYFDDFNYGYLRVVANKESIAFTYTPSGNAGGIKPDSVKVILATHQTV